MKKRVLSIFLALAMVASLLPMASLAEGTTNELTSTLDFTKDYTSSDYTAVADTSGAGYEWDYDNLTLTLTDDLSISVESGSGICLPSGDVTIDLGEYDLTVTATAGSAINSLGALTIKGTGTVDSTGSIMGICSINDMLIDGSTVTAKSSDTGTAIYTRGNATIQNGADVTLTAGVTGINTNGTTTSGSVSGGDYVGGIVGSATGNFTIDTCTNKATLSASGSERVGGILGATYATTSVNNSEIKNCTNEGTITSTAGCVGGIIGYGHTAKITACTNKGDINSAANCTGGIIGYSNSCIISGCTNEGGVTSTFTGTDSNSRYGVAGILGYSTGIGTSVNSCTNSGSITAAKSYVANIVGGGSIADATTANTANGTVTWNVLEATTISSDISDIDTIIVADGITLTLNSGTVLDSAVSITGASSTSALVLKADSLYSTYNNGTYAWDSAWSSTYYTISFTTGETYATGTMDTVYSSSSTYTLPECTFEGKGTGETDYYYVFTGWTMSDDETDTVYAPGDEVTLTGDTTFTAVWVEATSPDAPVLTATAGSSKVTLKWTVADDGGSAITNYYYCVYETADTDCETLIAAGDLDGTTTSVSVTALTNGTSYSFWVCAENALGWGNTSEAVTATPKASTSTTSGSSSSTTVDPDEDAEEETTEEETTEEETTETTTTTVGDFGDVTSDDWYAEAVTFAVDNGLFNGVSDSEFAPYTAMTRNMFFTVLYRMSGDESYIGGTNWYDDGSNWAVAEGISDGTLGDDSISREQLITMLWRYAGEPEATADLSAFDDADAASDWAEAAMAWAIEVGIITGRSDTELAASAGATRAEVATMLMRYMAL